MNDNLVIEGGALRGAFSYGVLFGLRREYSQDDLDFFDKFSSVAVTSASLLNMIFLQSKGSDFYDVGKCFWSNVADRTISNTLHIFNGEKNIISLEQILPPFWNMVGRSYNPSISKKVYFPTTHVNDERSVFHNLFDVLEDKNYSLITAAMSMPGITGNSVIVDGEEFIDGGVFDPIPISFSKKSQGKKVIITTNPHSVDSFSYSMMNFLTKNAFFISKKNHRKYLKFMEYSFETYDRHLKELTEMEKNGEGYVIRPEKPIDSYSSTSKKIGRVCDFGLSLGLSHRKSIDDFLKS